MNPHELIQKSFESMEVSDGFTERVLAAAERQQVKRPYHRLLAVLIAALVFVSCVSVAAYASPEFRHWLFSVVEMDEQKRQQVETEAGELGLTVDGDRSQIEYGAFFCVGRFLYTEVTFTTDAKKPITDEQIQEIVKKEMDHNYIELTYDRYYKNGLHPAWGEGWLRSYVRLDDGSVPGYARCTYYWTLARHDYDGTTLRVQLWEPIVWQADGNGGNGAKTAQNGTTRRLLRETRIERSVPEDEITCWMEDGMEVRICAFGAELQGDGVQKQLRQAMTPVNGRPDYGVILEDGNRVSFLNSPWGSSPADTPPELIWLAAPFSAAVDPAKVTAIYCEDEVFPLLSEQP